MQVALTPSSKSLIPFGLYFVKGESILADSGTEQLEFIALSQRTGDPKYQQKVFNSHSICSIFYGTIGVMGLHLCWFKTDIITGIHCSGGSL